MGKIHSARGRLVILAAEQGNAHRGLAALFTSYDLPSVPISSPDVYHIYWSRATLVKPWFPRKASCRS